MSFDFDKGWLHPFLFQAVVVFHCNSIVPARQKILLALARMSSKLVWSMMIQNIVRVESKIVNYYILGMKYRWMHGISICSRSSGKIKCQRWRDLSTICRVKCVSWFNWPNITSNKLHYCLVLPSIVLQAIKYVEN